MKIERHSPSSLNLFCACPSMFVLERILGRRQPVGSVAHRGTAVEHGLSLGLSDPERSVADCAAEAVRKFDALTGLTADPRREQHRGDIPVMVEQALEELRPYGVPSSAQGFVEWRPDGLAYPIVGYYDFAWESHGIVVDLKTTEKMPGQIKVPHARQVSLYAAALSDNIDPRLTYVTPKKRATYRLENVRAHRDTLYQIARRVEAFLALSDDPSFFVTITAPDLEQFYWSAPAARHAAYEVWAI